MMVIWEGSNLKKVGRQARKGVGWKKERGEVAMQSGRMIQKRKGLQTTQSRDGRCKWRFYGETRNGSE